MAVKQVTLVFTRAFSPYNKGDIATFDEVTAKALQNPTYINDRGREAPLPDGSPVEVYSAKEHKDLLVAQRGKEKDDAPVVPQTVAPGYYTGSELEAIVQARLEAERRRNVENGTPLSADISKVPVNQQQQAAGTVVTDPQGVSANGADPQAIQNEQRQVSDQLKADGDAPEDTGGEDLNPPADDSGDK